MHIHSKLFGASGPAETTGEVVDHCKTRKKPVQRLRCFSALSSGMTPPAPPSPTKNARRAAGH